MSDPNNSPSPEPAPGSAPAPGPGPAPAPQPSGELAIQAPREFVLPPSGDPAVDVANRFLVEKGITPGSAEWAALQAGDFGPAKAALAAKGVKGGAEYVAILEDRKAKADTAEKEAREATLGAVHAAAGGKERWTEITNWVAQNATDAELKEVNAALKGGAFMAKVMAEGLAQRYARTKGEAEVVDRIRPAPDVRGGAPAANGPMSAMEFREESRKLAQKTGGRVEGTKEYAALRARRAAGQAAGI